MHANCSAKHPSLDRVDLTILSPEKSDFIDDTIGNQYADAFFRVKFVNDRGYLYLLAKHQLTVEALMGKEWVRNGI